MQHRTVRPLDGITVVACEQAVAAPLATRQLADLGARVIKVERPDGDFARRYDTTVAGLSSHFVWLNRNKESVRLDLKDSGDRALLDRMIDAADVFVSNLAPGATDRLGLTAERLRAARPNLVCCAITGYGTDGPLRNAKAYDLLVQAETGLLSITGTEAEPAKCGIPVADIAAGSYAFSGVLAALFHRQRTGEGASIAVDLFDALLEWLGYPLLYTRYGGTAPARAGTSHPAIAPYGTFGTAGGGAVVLSVQNEREWAAFCAVVLAQPALAVDPRFADPSARVRNRAALDATVDAVFTALDLVEVNRRLEAAGIAHATQRDLVDVLDHPQLTERSRWTAVDTPGGPAEVLPLPVDWAGQQWRTDPVPALGQHTDAVRAEFAPRRSPDVDGRN